eukprot:gene10567-3086_t
MTQEDTCISVPNYDDEFGKEFSIFLTCKEKLNSTVLEYSSNHFLCDYVTTQTTDIIQTEEWDEIDENEWILRRYISTKDIMAPFHYFIFLIQSKVKQKVEINLNKNKMYEIELEENEYYYIGLLKKDEEGYKYLKKKEKFKFEKLEDFVQKTLKISNIEAPKNAHLKKFIFRENMTTTLPTTSNRDLCFSFDWKIIGNHFNIDLGVIAYNKFGREVEYLFQEKRKSSLSPDYFRKDGNNIYLNLPKLPRQVSSLIFTTTIYSKNMNYLRVKDSILTVKDVSFKDSVCKMKLRNTFGNSIIWCKIERLNNESDIWIFNTIDQSYNDKNIKTYFDLLPIIRNKFIKKEENEEIIELKNDEIELKHLNLNIGFKEKLNEEYHELSLLYFDELGYLKKKISQPYNNSEYSCLDSLINLNLSASYKSCFGILKGNFTNSKNGSILKFIDRESGEIFIKCESNELNISNQFICLFKIIFNDKNKKFYISKIENKIFESDKIQDWIDELKDILPGIKNRKPNELKINSKMEIKNNNLTIGVKKNTKIRVKPYDLASFKWNNIDEENENISSMGMSSGTSGENIKWINELKIIEGDVEQIEIYNLQSTFPFRYLFFYIHFDDIIKKNSGKKYETISIYDSDTFHEIYFLNVPISESFKKSEDNEILSFILKRDFNQPIWVLDFIENKNTIPFDISNYLIKPKYVVINVSKARNLKKKYETYVKIYENLAQEDTDSHDAESKHKSLVISSTDPEWNYSLNLPIPDKHCYTRIEVWKKRVIKKNKLLGFRTFSFKEFYDGKASWYSMKKKNIEKKCKGEMNIEFQYSF